MIGYATIGTNDLEKARGFYDALFETVGAKRLMQLDEGFTGYGKEMGQPMLCVTPPFNGEKATVGNGMMIALQAEDRAEVDALHAKALELGADDEGAPGLREPEEMGFYAAYFRDLDGNKLCAFKVG
ncbi:VOC family protein [Parasphingopyxis algicola]|uniref:VOC family protein n=1 Tax=Parasphingopyxis algicola TaxID=2026624 RepID=UPI00159FAB74|nr:VOC family protein [Parasphingopyxis algicola]QLC25834.1 VOC family protein [Parasphingopyxis algicola]